ncbi:MAG: divalent cation tolerance protein CutA [Candidatus Thermoplasmatota archaeon]|nr:divalent cation tolerance protein CutA [Candidatus Thermoplasmatota archaeon]
MGDGIMMVQTTLPGEMNEAELGQWCQDLIDSNLAACIDMKKVRSIFRWDQEVVSEFEWQVQMVTSVMTKDGLVSRVKSSHPYDVPEITWWPAEAIQEYSDWVNKREARLK